MSLTFQQLVSDAKKLAGRLKDRENVADVLLNETHAINKKIDAMKQVCIVYFNSVIAVEVLPINFKNVNSFN